MKRLILEPWGAHLYLATTQKQVDAAHDATDADGREEWNSAGQVQSYIHGAFGKSPPRLDLILAVDEKGLRDDPGELLRTVAHEAYHAAALLHDWTGQTYSGTSEPIAYLIGQITEWVWRQVS